LIKYRISEDGGVTWGGWLIYEDGNNACGEMVQAKAMIHFCDDACATICLTAECESCTPFDAGAPSNIAVCNSGNI